MKHLRSTLALASLLSLGGGAQADLIDVTFRPGQTATIPWAGEVSSPSAYVRLDASEQFSTVLEIMFANVDSVTPAIKLVDLGEYPLFLSVEAPYSQSIAQFDTDSGAMPIKSVSTDGGFNISTAALAPSGRKNAATTGGSLSVTGLTVRPGTQQVFADIVGGNGVGSHDNVLLWHANGTTGLPDFQFNPCPLTPLTPCEAPSLAGFTLTDLTITENAFNLVAQSLGLTTFGKTALGGGVTSYGSISVSAIPEPGSAGLMIMGMAAFFYAGRQAKRINPASRQA